MRRSEDDRKQSERDEGAQVLKWTMWAFLGKNFDEQYVSSPREEMSGYEIKERNYMGQ